MSSAAAASKKDPRWLFSLTSAKIAHNWRTPRAGQVHYLAGVNYMTPGGRRICPWALSCLLPCLNESGKGGKYETVKMSRARKTRAFLAGGSELADFVNRLQASIDSLRRKAKIYGRQPTQELRNAGAVRFSGEYTPVVRLNGTSDIPWENDIGGRQSLITANSDLTFYDYTKSSERMLSFLDGKMPRNYHLTFSMGGTEDDAVPDILRRGGNVTVVFPKGDKPKRWGGDVVIRTPKGTQALIMPVVPCINGDTDDLRFLDEVEKKAKGISTGVVVALSMKTITNKVKALRLQQMMQDGKLPGFVFSPRLGEFGAMSPPRTNPGSDAATEVATQGLADSFGCAAGYGAQMTRG